MKEQIDVTSGSGLLRICGDNFETALFMGETPVALLWCDNQGTIGQMLAHANVAHISSRLTQLRRVADGHLDASPLSSQIYPLLELLQNGSYQLELRSPESTWELIEVNEQRLGAVDEFYPLDAFLMTQPLSTLAEARVVEFIKLIEQGTRPIVFCLTAEESYATFVVDGHHKLAAYRRCNVAPLIVEVRRMSPSPLDESQEKNFFRTQAEYSIYQASRRRGSITRR